LIDYSSGNLIPGDHLLTVTTMRRPAMDHVLDLQALEAADQQERDTHPSVASNLSLLLCD
jgi:hypothetical protein